MIDRGVTTPAPPQKKKRQDALVGQVLAGKYKILKKIGEGGMGSVYIATQEPMCRGNARDRNIPAGKSNALAAKSHGPTRCHDSSAVAFTSRAYR